MLSSGQLLGREEREPDSLAMAEGNICEVKHTNEGKSVLLLSLLNSFLTRETRHSMSRACKGGKDVKGQTGKVRCILLRSRQWIGEFAFLSPQQKIMTPFKNPKRTHEQVSSNHSISSL